MKTRKGSYWKLNPKLRKIEEKRWIRNNILFNKHDKEIKKVELNDITPDCVLCHKKPVNWVIKVDDFISDTFPEIDLRYIYCCSEECTHHVCGLINLGGVQFYDRKTKPASKLK